MTTLGRGVRRSTEVAAADVRPGSEPRRLRHSAWARAALAVATLCSACVSSKTGSEAEQARLAEYILDESPEVKNKLAISYDGKIELVGYDINPATSVHEGSKMRLVMYWTVKEKLPRKDWLLFTHLIDDRGSRVLNIDNVGPLRSSPKDRNKQALPPGYWEPGKFYVDTQVFRLPKKLDTKEIRFVTGIWRDKERLPVVSGPKLDGDRGLVVAVKVRPKKEKPKTVPEGFVPRLGDGKVVIDGKLDEAAWSRAFDTGPFVDVSTGKAPKDSPVGGRAKLLWDDEFLYAGFEVKDPNVVGGFDPDEVGDNKDYYEVQVGPQNLVFDSRFDSYNAPKTEPKGPFGHQDWSAKLQSAVTIQGTLDDPNDQDTGYTVEVKIPWKSFDKAKTTPPAPGDTWRVNLYAMQNNGGVSWSPILRQGNFHKAPRFGKLKFVSSLTPVDPSARPAPSSSAAAPSGSVPPTAASGVPPAPSASGRAPEMPKKIHIDPTGLKKAAGKLAAPR